MKGKEVNITLPTILEGEDKSSPFVNCIRNNYRHVRKWAKRTSTNCFRIYDRQMHEYPLAIDYYAGRFCVQYFSRSRENNEPLPELANEVDRVLRTLFGARPESIYWHTRIRRKKMQQYEKRDTKKDFFTVYEYGLRFMVNLRDYLDTGLFLDHRETRKRVATLAKGKRVLNLFAYTCAFSIHAAAAGASFTKSIDLSNTYTAWGKRNFALNSLSLENNEIVRADCLKFLDEEIHRGLKYDIIIIDPPTISRSKKMDKIFDIQVDYIPLLTKALKLLLKGGVLFFSTNSRKFAFDASHFPSCSIMDVSEKTIPIDFHNSRIHRCWRIALH